MNNRIYSIYNRWQRLHRGLRLSLQAVLALALSMGTALLIMQEITSGNLSMNRKLDEPEFTVCIDPGHPTEFSSGKRIQNGTCEMEINWEIANRLADVLQNYQRIKVIMTRETRDLVMTNPQRAVIANNIHANLLLRLHCDAGPSTGFTVYYPDRQGTDLGKTGPSREVIDSSRTAAIKLHSGMTEVLDGVLRNRGVRGEHRTLVGSRQGVLTGSIFCEVPVVTVEMVFLSNKEDACFIKSEIGQEMMTEALAEGVIAYIGSLRN